MVSIVRRASGFALHCQLQPRGSSFAQAKQEMLMLKGINPLLVPELIRALRAMGHGDEIAIVDANFPATSLGPPTIRLDGVTATAALEAVLSVLPLDDFVPEAAWRMEVVGDPDAWHPVFADFRAALDRHEHDGFPLGQLERYAFYARAKACFAVVVTGERRLYGNIILKKGVIRSAS
jgi:L-fucose mutarotase